MRNLVATGGRAGAGKDHILNMLLAYEAGRDRTWRKSGFGDLVRAELRDLGWLQPTREQQQLRGQIRRREDENYWTKKAVEWANMTLRAGYGAVGFTGVRFENELAVLKEGGFYLVLVEAPEEVRLKRLEERDGRPWTTAELNDVTETSLDLIPREKWDAIIWNA